MPIQWKALCRLRSCHLAVQGPLRPKTCPRQAVATALLSRSACRTAKGATVTISTSLCCIQETRSDFVSAARMPSTSVVVVVLLVLLLSVCTTGQQFVPSSCRDTCRNAYIQVGQDHLLPPLSTAEPLQSPTTSAGLPAFQYCQCSYCAACAAGTVPAIDAGRQYFCR